MKILLLTTLLILAPLGYAQTQPDSAVSLQNFDSELLRLKVPDAFRQSSLKLEIFSDSSWQLYRGQEELNFEEALMLLGLSDELAQYHGHRDRSIILQKEYRSRRVFAMVSALGGATYLAVIWSKGWVYQIPGYAAISIAAVRYLDSRKLEVETLREQYYQSSLIKPSTIQLLVDDYNFRLYQFLSSTGIHFRGE